MRMEGFEQNNSLSAEQQERKIKFAELSARIEPLMAKLAETGVSIDADAIMEEVDRFKAESKQASPKNEGEAVKQKGAVLKKETADISDEQVRDFLKSIQ